MKASPIQLQQLSFRRVNVEFDVERHNAGELDLVDKSLAFDNVRIATHVGLAPMDQEEEPGKRYLLTLQVVIDKKITEDGSTSKPAPHLIDIEEVAVILVAKGAEALGAVSDVIVDNGTSQDDRLRG